MILQLPRKEFITLLYLIGHHTHHRAIQFIADRKLKTLSPNRRQGIYQLDYDIFESFFPDSFWEELYVLLLVLTNNDGTKYTGVITDFKHWKHIQDKQTSSVGKLRNLIDTTLHLYHYGVLSGTTAQNLTEIRTSYLIDISTRYKEFIQSIQS